MKKLVEDVLPLASRFNMFTREQHLGRLFHVLNEGFLMCLLENGKVVGYAELYQLNGIPKLPAIPYPKNDKNGRMLYVWACSADGQAALRKMKRMAKQVFTNCEELVYHRLSRNGRLRKERI